MAAYSYKFARAKIPQYITDAIDGYEGEANYDGDLWIAADEYIVHLETELARQYEMTGKMHNEKLLDWLKNRPQDCCYCYGPVIQEDSKESTIDSLYGKLTEREKTINNLPYGTYSWFHLAHQDDICATRTVDLGDNNEL